MRRYLPSLAAVVPMALLAHALVAATASPTPAPATAAVTAAVSPTVAGPAVPAGTGANGGLPVDPAWAADPIWDDGLAEVSLYDAERVVYGKPRAYELRMIVVKEDLSDDQHVKADPPYAGRALTGVLKMNLAATIQTDNYPYQYLTSIFVRRDDVRALVKATVGSQEWCGNTFKEVITWDGPPRIHAHSYFEGQGDVEHPLPLDGTGLLDEQLLLVLRAATVPDGSEWTVRVADTMTTNNGKEVAVRETRLSSAGTESLVTPLGRVTAHRYRLTQEGGESATYWIDVAPPRSVMRMESSDGRRLILKERARRDYWTRR